ncbi:MAG TPA: septum formation family protein [Candidatus Limnocylindria bacterium]
MNERWVCKRCFADNEDTSAACVKCGLIRGAEAPSDDQAAWAAQAAAEPAKQAGWTRWLRFAWIPIAVVVLAAGYWFSAGRNSEGDIERGGTLSVTDLRVGDCFNTGEETEITDVSASPCDEAHEFEVFHVQDHETATFPTDAEFAAITEQICFGPFESFVGVPYVDSVLYARAITPSASSFEEGDRGYICVLFDPENPEMTASMEGANR